jgi:hypothetical protein
MKRIIISAGLMCVILIYCFFADNLIARESERLLILTDGVEAAVITGDWVSAEIIAEEMVREAENFMKRVNIFVKDDRLNSLEQCARRILPFAQTGNDELLAETAMIREEISSYADAERFSWYNLL